MDKSFVNKGEVFGLSYQQREVLIEHIDGPVPLDYRDSSRIRTVESLQRGLFLKKVNNAHVRPKELMLSERGRAAVAMILAEYAETLVNAGCLDLGYPDPESLFKALTTMKTLRRNKTPSRPPEIDVDPAIADEP